MDFYKILLFLLINLVNLDFNLAEESGNGEISTEAESATYSKFPLSLLLGGYNKKGEEITTHGRKGASVYDNDDEDLVGIKSRAVYWIPTSCDSLAERGYTCLSCGESLHCMGGNFALKAICGGRRPFCSNGVCSDIRGDKCRRDDVHTAPVQTHNHTANAESDVELINNSTLT